MTDHDALLAAILAAPDDDTPRKVYADYLEERDGDVPCGRCGGDGDLRINSMGYGNQDCRVCSGSGRVPNGYAERAEFVRVQCELARLSRWPCGGYYCDEAIGHVDCEDPTGDKAAALRKRDQELWPQVVPTFDVPADWLVDVHRRGTDRSAVVRRGFIDEVSLTLAAFVGGPCGQCGNHYDNHRLGLPAPENCPDCSGTGRVGGLAERLFRAHPVTKVVISDAVIHPSGGNDTYYVGGLGMFPSEYWRRLDNHRSRSAASAALNDVCVAYGRSLAGLPPLARPKAVAT